MRKRICFQTLMAEAISHLFAPLVGARVPDGAVYRDDPEHEWDWMSRVVRDARHWEPRYRDVITNLDEVAAMMVLDAVLLNEDRHHRNVLVVPDDDDIGVQLWAIDFGNALVGFVDDFIARGLAPPSEQGVRKHAAGLPVDAIRSCVAVPLDKMRRVSRTEINAVVRAACQLANEPEGTSARLADALEQRCRAAPDFVPCYFDALEARS